MKLTINQGGCTLVREADDKAILHESTVASKMKQILNLPTNGYHFVRYNPSKHGLTSCTVGLIDRKVGIILWHERYLIENAAKEFNRGKVWFMRVPYSCDVSEKLWP